MAEDVSKSYGARAIVSGLSLVLSPGMRLGLIGANGSGKRTLLRLLARLEPPDGGSVEHAPGLRVVMFDQHRSRLDPAVSLQRTLAPYGDSVVFQGRGVHVAGWAKRFLFRTEQLETPVGRLSGGEQARAVLARLMLEPADLLLLDEPTNDLDIPTLEVLEESLLEFPGALVLVTHDRFLLDRVSTRILALDGRGGALPYADYDQWEAARQSALAGEPGEAEAVAEGGGGAAAEEARLPRAARVGRDGGTDPRGGAAARGVSRGGRRSRRGRGPQGARPARSTSWRRAGRGRAALRALGGARGEAQRRLTLGRGRAAHPLTRQPLAASSGRSRSRWSPWISTLSSAAVPPVPHARLSSLASAPRKAALRGSPATTVTVLPPRPFFSSRSTQLSFAGSGWSSRDEQWQSSAGQPHFGHTRPLPVW